MEKKEQVVERLKKVIDPETGVDVFSMNMIEDLEVSEDGAVTLKFRPTSPFCPMGVQLAVAIKESLKDMEGISGIEVKITGHLQEDAINEMLCKE